jgi:peptidyl-prolyl cis-trans isomerase D
MLKEMRKGVKSMTAKVLVALLVISFAVWGIGDIFTLRLDSRVAKVGDAEVSAEAFADALLRQQSRISREAGELVSFEQLRQAGVAGAVLNSLIRDAAFGEELEALGLSASDAKVADAIRQHPAFQGPGGQFSAQFYQLSLQQQGMSVPEFEALTRTLLAQDILVETARAGAVPPPGAAQRIAVYRGEARGVNVMTLTLDTAPDPGTPDEAALSAFYEANQERFRLPERRWGEYLHIDPERLIAGLAPSEDELRAAYEAERDRYTVAERRAIDQLTFPDRAAAEAAMAQLASGEVSFEAIAGQRGMKPADTDLGQVTQGDLPQAAAGLVFGAAEPGIVGPVGLPAGFAVYRVREITPGGARPFEEVRDELAERLARDAALREAPEVANKVEELRAAGKTMAEIAAETAAVHSKIEGLAQDGSLAAGGKAEGLPAEPAFLEEVFAALDAEERDLVETEAGGYFLVMVSRTEPSRVPPLKEIRDRVAEAWRDARRLEALEARAAEIAGRLGEDASIWDVGDELGVAVLPLAPFTRLNPPEELPPALIDKVFRARSAGGVFAAAPEGDRVVVAQVASITVPQPEQIETQSRRIDEALADSLSRDMAEYFARAIVARHEPRIEPGVVEEVFSRLGGQAGQ